MTALSELKVPGPTETDLTAKFWRGAENGKLLIQRCEDCGEAVFYPREICPHCWSGNLKWIEASGGGRLKSFSAVYKPGHPGWGPVAPYFVGLVELDEGPTMLSHILSPGGAPAVGDRLSMKAENIGGRTLPLFQTDNGRRKDG
ncbi:MAG: Zn-ribbon domain-containing OB-fold protein [Rhizobiaceae bacterium]|nr:Zn-ribbon domain-containing OB-fold protein [Rhizobiaceae bacterium]